MDNNVMERYVDFISSEITPIQKVLLWIPSSIKDEVYIPKIGPKVYIKVNIEIIEKYTRSSKFKLKFDKYEIEDMFFMSRHKSPDLIFSEIERKIENIINNTFLDDNREGEIIEKYKEQHSILPKFISNLNK